MKKLIKQTKKLWLIVGLCVIGLTSSAQNHLSQSFLANGISSLTISNLIAATNLNYALTIGTNKVGLIFTNMGSLIVVTQGWGTDINVFNDVSLWSDREGRPYNQTTTNVTDSTLFTTPMSLVTRTISGSGANGAVLTAVFAPVYDESNGLGGLGSAKEVTGTTAQWTVTYTLAASSDQVFYNPVPLYRWPGAKKLRLLYMSSSDTDASSDIKIIAQNLDGFRP